MNELKRTLIYVAVAAVSVGGASATYFATRPKLDTDYVDVGKEFYPDFQDPTAAQVLRVVAYNPDTASVKEFKVEYRDGKWRIPSHHNYPADGKDRLARTAASVIGTSRVALVSRLKSDQARYDVVDPEDTDATILKGRGQKITIAKNDGSVLAEYIIGKKAEPTGPAQGQTDAYYVRATKTNDHDSVYLAKLKIDLSTKFSDWIEPSLLKVDRDNLTNIRIDSYSIDEQQMAIVPGDVTELTKKSATDAWKLTGLKEDKEELKTDMVNQLVNGLDGLKLVGVRPKPRGINADLSVDSRVPRELVMALKGDMANRGFLVANDPRTGKPHIFSKEGELDAGTNEGVRYAMRFGQIFTGTEFEIETGLSKDSKDSKDKDGKDAKSADKTKPDANKPGDANKKSRYLMVYASFEPKLVGEAPSKPIEPKKPAGLVLDKPAEKGTAKPHADSKSTPSASGKVDKKQSAMGSHDDSQMLALALPDAKGDAKSDTKSKPAGDAAKATPAAKGASATAKDAKPAPTKPAAPLKPDPKAEYDKALGQYKKDLEKYENDKSLFEKKLKKGEEKVKELNDRFGPWYYVISAESFENLRLNRASLVKAKEKPGDKKDAAGEMKAPVFPPTK